MRRILQYDQVSLMFLFCITAMIVMMYITMPELETEGMMLWVVRVAYTTLTCMVLMFMLMPNKIKSWQKLTFVFASSFFLLAMTAFSSEMIFHYALLFPMMSILIIEEKRTCIFLLFSGLIAFISLSFLNNHIQTYDRLLATSLFVFYGVIALLWKHQLKSIENKVLTQATTFEQQKQEWGDKILAADKENQHRLKNVEDKAQEQAVSFEQQQQQWNKKLIAADKENQRLMDMVDNETTMHCRYLLGLLNDAERADIKLHVKQGMTLEGIAEEVHRSVAAIKKRRKSAGIKLEAEGSSVKELESLLNQCSYYQINRE